ncbi:MAG: DUF5103 domain-containing protein [Prevotellaceae bacterium]|nr:DUF5103 domain-containing protein [Prevotellaceae bacterium]
MNGINFVPHAKVVCLVACMLCFAPLFAQQQDRDIHNVQCFVGDNELSDPIMEFRGKEHITLWFDDFNETRNYLHYALVHCDADWNEDGLFFSDYMDGFVENPLRDYALSFQTQTNYVYYRLQIPNEDVQLKASGNYLIKIYERDPEKPVLTQRFSVYEKAVAVKLNTRGPMLTGESCLQQLEFSVRHPALPVRDAYRELKVRVTQNGIALPGVENPSPSFIEQHEVSYTLATKNWYPGGNEYRIFDIRTLDFGAQGVQQVRYDELGVPYALLTVDTPREHKPYTFVRDLNGKYRVEANRRTNRHAEAEYVMAGFTLDSEEFQDAGVFVFGQLSNFALRPEFAMTYNVDAGAYELNVPLKQAYYNYRYVLVPHNQLPDWNAIEGCFAEAENYYTVLVYYRSFRDRYDRLVGVHSVNTL